MDSVPRKDPHVARSLKPRGQDRDWDLPFQKEFLLFIGYFEELAKLRPESRGQGAAVKRMTEQ